jgi:hypothetical protein
MKGHQGYVRVDQEIETKPVVQDPEPKKVGRPKKVENV